MKSHKIFKGWVNNLVIIDNWIKIIIFEKNLQTSTLIVKQVFTMGFQNNFHCIETTILSLYRKMRVRGNPYSGIFYTEFLEKKWWKILINPTILMLRNFPIDVPLRSNASFNRIKVLKILDLIGGL